MNKTEALNLIQFNKTVVEEVDKSLGVIGEDVKIDSVQQHEFLGVLARWSMQSEKLFEKLEEIINR